MTASNALRNDDLDSSDVLTRVPPTLGKHLRMKGGKLQRVTVSSFVQICIMSQYNVSVYCPSDTVS